MLFPPEFRRRFRGRIIVHDAEAEDLVEIGEVDGIPLRVNRALVDTDLVLPVTAAETVVDGGPGALLAACGPESLRAASSPSLLEASGSQGWKLALEVERRLQDRVALTGVSLALNLTRIAGPFAGYPHDEEAVERMLRSRVRWLFQLAPAPVRQRDPRWAPARTDRGGRLRRDAVGRARGGAAAWHGVQGVRAGRPARRGCDRDPADDPVDAA